MKKDLITHFCFAAAFISLVFIYRRWFSLTYLPFIYGGIIGTILPDLDYILYAYILRPKEGESQQVAALVSEKKIVKTLDFLNSAYAKRSDLLFHTASFQALFVIFAFWVVTSAGSLLGSGLVLMFLLHLLIDEVADWAENKNLDRWFINFPVKFDAEQRYWYLIANGILILAFGILL